MVKFLWIEKNSISYCGKYDHYGTQDNDLKENSVSTPNDTRDTNKFKGIGDSATNDDTDDTKDVLVSDIGSMGESSLIDKSNESRLTKENESSMTDNESNLVQDNEYEDESEDDSKDKSEDKSESEFEKTPKPLEELAKSIIINI